MSERRRFIDSNGYSWQVYEIARADAGPVTDERGRVLREGSLYFFSRDDTRVLSPYPADWVVASWRELVIRRGPGSGAPTRYATRWSDLALAAGP
jgi:hypothetical protein